LELEKGTKVRCKLNCNLIYDSWFSGTLITKPNPNGNIINVYINRDDRIYSEWFVDINENNKQYFKLADQEWDEEEND